MYKFLSRQHIRFYVVAISLLLLANVGRGEESSLSKFSVVLDQPELLANHHRKYLGSILRRIWLAGGPQISIQIVNNLGSTTPEQHILEIGKQIEAPTGGGGFGVVILIDSQGRRVHIGRYPPSESLEGNELKKNVLEQSIKNGRIFEGLKQSVIGISELLAPGVDLAYIKSIDENLFLTPKKRVYPKWLWLLLLVPFLVVLRKKLIKSSPKSLSDNYCQLSLRRW